MDLTPEQATIVGVLAVAILALMGAAYKFGRLEQSVKGMEKRLTRVEMRVLAIGGGSNGEDEQN